MLISPGFTKLFIGDDPYSGQDDEVYGEMTGPFDPGQLLDQTGNEWNGLPYRQKLEFIVHILDGLDSRDMEVSMSAAELVEEMDTYFHSEQADQTIEKAIMSILSEEWKKKSDPV